jgi:RNA polymerase sigma-70 factor (ECF subfamily)
MADFDRIVAAFGPALVRVASSYERNPALREELVQDMLLAIARALPRLRDEARLRPFVFRIAHNKGVDHVARHVAGPSTDSCGPEQPARDDVSPEDDLIRKQSAERLAGAVRRLDLPYRQVITLLLEDLSYGEIAEALGISISNVGVRVNRAKAQLRTLLDHG